MFYSQRIRQQNRKRIKKMTKAKKATDKKVKATDKVEVVVPVVLAEKSMEEQLAEMQAQMKLLMTANSELKEKLTTKVVKDGFSPAQKNEVRLIIGSLNDPFSAYTLKKRKAVIGDRLKKKWASKYFAGQAILNDCKKALKKGKLVKEAIKAGNEKYVELYPNKKAVETFQTDINGKYLLSEEGEKIALPMVPVLTEIVDLLNKARSAKRDDTTLHAHSLPLDKEATIYYLTDKTDSIDVVKVTEEKMEVVVFGSTSDSGLATMLFKEIKTGLDMKHATLKEEEKNINPNTDTPE